MIRNFFAISAALLLVACQVTETEEADQSDESVLWTTPECEFLVRFPSTPEERTREVVGVGEFRAADLVIGKSAFRADCATLPPGAMEALGGNRRNALKAVLAENARRSGIEPVEIALTDLEGFTVATASGSKNVEGSRVTYKMAASIGDRTIVSAMIGAPSTDFPMPDQTEFIQSIELKGN